MDSNVLLYSISADPREVSKRDIARDVLATRQCVMSVQVLNEFVWQTTRVRSRHRLSRALTKDLTTRWSKHDIRSLDLHVFRGAWDIAEQTNYSWWDCLIIAAAQTAGCDLLLTEDMQHGHVIDSLRIENPFRGCAV